MTQRLLKLEGIGDIVEMEIGFRYIGATGPKTGQVKDQLFTIRQPVKVGSKNLQAQMGGKALSDSSGPIFQRFWTRPGKTRSSDWT